MVAVEVPQEQNSVDGSAAQLGLKIAGLGLEATRLEGGAREGLP